MSYFSLTDEERRSFLGADPKFASIDGPIALVRFIDTTRGKRAMSGRFWMYGSEVHEVLASGGPSLIREISDRWAICDDWGDCGLAAILHVPAGTQVDAWFGFAKFQPRISVKAQKTTGRKTTNSYAGGSIQLILNVTEQERRWMSGPYHSVQLQTKYLRSSD